MKPDTVHRAPHEWLQSWGAPSGHEAPRGPLPPGRRLLHTLLVLAGWVGFVWGWWRVAGGQHDVAQLRLLILGSIVVVVVLTLGWVAHNVGIHRRKGPRKSVPRVQPRHEVDFNGRRLDADWEALRQARRVDIELDGDCKHFVSPDGPPPRRERVAEEVA